MVLVVEPMRLEDISAVMAIERESFTMLWSAQAYRREILENRLARYFVVHEVPDDLVNPDCTPRTVRQPVAERVEGGPPGPIRHLVANVKQWLGSPADGRITHNLLGYVGFWMMVDEAHITTIAVAPGQRRRGIGEVLLSTAIDHATELGASVATLEVRVSNLSAQRMYEKYGFVRTGLRRRYYSDNNEDALIMTSPQIASASYQSLFQRLKQENRKRLGRVCRWGW